MNVTDWTKSISLVKVAVTILSRFFPFIVQLSEPVCCFLIVLFLYCLLVNCILLDERALSVGGDRLYL